MKKAKQEKVGSSVFFVGRDKIFLNEKILKDNNLLTNSLKEKGDFWIDYKNNKGKIKINTVHKDVFNSDDDNFAIRLYKSPIFKNYIEPKSQLLKIIERPKFNYILLKDLWQRQLLHSLTICDGMPLRVEQIINETKSEQLENVKKNYIGSKDYKTKWRLAIGLGGSSVFETGMTLHHLYGFPYIPASSIKGILRSWIITEYFQKDDNNKSNLINAEFNALDNKTFCLIFGCSKDRQKVLFDDNRMPLLNKKGKYKTKTEPSALEKDHIGNIVFFDAYPTSEKINVEVDVMTPHYQPYYNDEDNIKPPADYYNPVPIHFLTVKDTSFQFLFGIRKGITDKELNCLKKDDLKFCGKTGNIIKILSELLKEALIFNGIGAKTAVGYGRMKQANENN